MAVGPAEGYLEDLIDIVELEMWWEGEKADDRGVCGAGKCDLDEIVWRRLWAMFWLSA